MEIFGGSTFTPLSQWKKVESTGVCDLDSGFGGLEVLEHYDCQVVASNSHSAKLPKAKVPSKRKGKHPEEHKEHLTKGRRVMPVGMKKRKKKAGVTAPNNSEVPSNRQNIKKANETVDQVPIDMLLSRMNGWKDLFVPLPVLKALHECNFYTPTLIQALTLPAAIRDRLDVLGAAETGSGKTLAFGIPVIDKILKLKEAAEHSEQRHMERRVYALVLTPTRELCVQVKNHLAQAAKYTDISVVAIFGGLSTQKQVRLLKSQPEVIVATPGRLWDIMNSEEVVESYISSVIQSPLLVIDEADKMVEKGHFEELTKVLTLMKRDEESSQRRQCFVFSATLTYVHLAPDRLNKLRGKKRRSKKLKPSKESKLEELIATVGILKRPKVVDVTEKSQTASALVESCIFCTQSEKDLYLYYFLERHVGRTLIFTNSIDCIRRLLSVFTLLRKPLLPLHASMHQKQRLKNLEKFTQSCNGVLIATDVAARGLDIPDIQHVIHYQVPRTAESYVHRSGRTARALKDGLSVLFVDEKDLQGYRKILKSLSKDDTLSTFPVAHSDLRLMKPIVSLAQRIDSTQHKADKAKRHDDWFVKMAKDADLELSDDGSSDHEPTEKLQLKLKERREIERLKMELTTMLDGVGDKGSSYQGKYPTGSGKLELPKAMTVNTCSKAITLVSRRKHK